MDSLGTSFDPANEMMNGGKKGINFFFFFSFSSLAEIAKGHGAWKRLEERFFYGFYHTMSSNESNSFQVEMEMTPSACPTQTKQSQRQRSISMKLMEI